jgi:hypothetical protein
MTPQLKQYLNRSILVSIPAPYEDGRCCAYTLRALETMAAVWSVVADPSKPRVHPDARLKTRLTPTSNRASPMPRRTHQEPRFRQIRRTGED